MCHHEAVKALVEQPRGALSGREVPDGALEQVGARVLHAGSSPRRRSGGRRRSAGRRSGRQQLLLGRAHVGDHAVRPAPRPARSRTCLGQRAHRRAGEADSAPSSASSSEPAARRWRPARARARSRSGLRPKPTTSAPATCSWAASPIDPPIRPTPRTAILIRGGRARTAVGQLLQHLGGGVPVHAGVGDRLAVGERRAGPRGPGARRPGTTPASRRRSRCCRPRPGAPTSAAAAGWRVWSLRLLSCEASITTRSGRPAARSCPSASSTALGAVVGRVRARRAGSCGSRGCRVVWRIAGVPALVDTCESVRHRGGAHGVDRDLHVAVGAVLEARPASTGRSRAGGAIWLSVVRAPIAPQATASEMYCGVIGSRNSQPDRQAERRGPRAAARAPCAARCSRRPSRRGAGR